MRSSFFFVGHQLESRIRFERKQILESCASEIFGWVDLKGGEERGALFVNLYPR